MNQLPNLTREIIIVEPDAVNLKNFDKMIDTDIAKINLGFKKTDFTIGYVGCLARGRGVEQILEIALKLPDEFFFYYWWQDKATNRDT